MIFLYLCFIGRSIISLKHVKRRIDLSAMGQILRLGIFSSMQGFLRHASRLGFIRVVAIYGTNAVAAYAICMRLRILVMHLGFGFANAVAPMVGQNIGAGSNRQGRESCQSCRWIGNGAHGCARQLIIFLSPFVHQYIYRTNGSYHYRGSLPPLLISYFCIYRNFYRIWSCAQRCRDTVSPMVMTFICQIGIGLLLVILLSYLVGIKGVWIGIALSNVVQGVLMWLWFRRGTWKTKKLVGKK